MGLKHYDLIVIGSGAGLNVANQAADWGWEVAVVENGPLGGTCLNRGCIPSKIIIHAAEVAETVSGAAKFGIKAHIDNIDFKKIIERATVYVDTDSKNIERGLSHHPKIHLYKADAKFMETYKLSVGEDEITAKKIVISAGARPAIPPIPGLDEIKFLTSTEALRLNKLPKTMVVIGGGYIAAELGNFYGALGTKITILEMGDVLVPREDIDISKTFTKLFGEKYNLMLGAKIDKISQSGDDEKIVFVKSSDGKNHEIHTEEILVTTGIRPNSDGLKVSNAGIKVSEKGYIEVNSHMETNVPGIWALGDIVGKAPFRHGANYESRIVAHNLHHPQHKAQANYDIMPHAIFTSPQVAGVGLTEAQAKAAKIKFQTKKFPYKSIAMGKAIEEKDGFVKWILDQSGENILGCHIIGPNASILIHEVVVVLKGAGGKAAAIREAIHVHPSLSEVIGWGI